MFTLRIFVFITVGLLKYVSVRTETVRFCCCTNSILFLKRVMNNFRNVLFVIVFFETLMALECIFILLANRFINLAITREIEIQILYSRAILFIILYHFVNTVVMVE